MIKLLCIMGKAGAGKDTIARYLINSHPILFSPVVSFTSRPMREKEIAGKDYYFIPREQFESKINNNEILEWTHFNNWYYGTTLESFDKNKINVCVCNPEGVASFKKMSDIFEITVVYVDVPAKTRLLRQLNREENPDVDEIVRRYGADEENFKKLEFDFWAPNDGQPICVTTQYIVSRLIELGKI